MVSSHAPLPLYSVEDQYQESADGTTFHAPCSLANLNSLRVGSASLNSATASSHVYFSYSVSPQVIPVATSNHDSLPFSRDTRMKLKPLEDITSVPTSTFRRSMTGTL